MEYIWQNTTTPSSNENDSPRKTATFNKKNTIYMVIIPPRKEKHNGKSNK